MQHIPVLHDLAVRVQPKNVNAGPVAIVRPMLMTVEDHEIAVGENPSKLDMLSRVVARHALEILDECVLAVRDGWVVLRVRVSDVPTNGFGRV